MQSMCRRDARAIFIHGIGNFFRCSEGITRVLLPEAGHVTCMTCTTPDHLSVWRFALRLRSFPRFVGNLLFLLSLVALSGCTVVGHVKTDGWPELHVLKNKVSFATMLEHCSKYVHPLMWPPVACAEFDLAAGSCRIWYVWDAQLEHEQQHCRGYDHIGGGTMAELVRVHRAAKSDSRLAEAPFASVLNR